VRQRAFRFIIRNKITTSFATVTLDTSRQSCGEARIARIGKYGGINATIWERRDDENDEESGIVVAVEKRHGIHGDVCYLSPVRQGRIGNPATSEYTLEIEVCHPNAAWEILGVRSIWCLFNQESKASLPKVPATVRRRANDIGNVDSGIDDNGGRSEMICPWPLLL